MAINIANKDDLDSIASSLYIASGVLGAAVGLVLILICVLFMYVKNIEKQLKRMPEGGHGQGQGGLGESSFLPRLDSPPKPFGQGQGSSQYGGHTPSYRGYEAAPIRNPFNRQQQESTSSQQPWQNEPQGGGGGYGFNKPPQQQRPGGPGPQRPARMGY